MFKKFRDEGCSDNYLEGWTENTFSPVGGEVFSGGGGGGGGGGGTNLCFPVGGRVSHE